MQKDSPRIRSVRYFICEIFQKCFAQIYKALYEAPFLRKIGKLKIGLNVVEKRPRGE